MSFEVVIVGGGIAALEGALALRALAGERVNLTLVSPRADFVLTPLAVGEPFSVARAPKRPIAEIAHELGARHVAAAVTRVLPDAKLIELSDGRELAYDALLLAPGARPSAALDRALTFFAEEAPTALSGIVADLEEGRSKSAAFVVPPGVHWTLPAYELALLTARAVGAMGIDDARLTIVTPEQRPLALLGGRAGDAVGELLEEAGIAIECGAYAEPGVEGGRLRLMPGERELRVERIVALPTLHGPRLPGVPCDADGFIPTDEHARVRHLADVFAAGDGTQFPVKQGGIATQQADAAAEMMAARAGVGLIPQPFRPVLRGRLLTGSATRLTSTDDVAWSLRMAAGPRRATLRRTALFDPWRSSDDPSRDERRGAAVHDGGRDACRHPRRQHHVRHRQHRLAPRRLRRPDCPGHRGRRVHLPFHRRRPLNTRPRAAGPRLGGAWPGAT